MHERPDPYSKRIGRSPRTLRYWVARGCDLSNEASVRQFVAIADAELPPLQESAAGALRRMEDAFEGSPLIFTRDSTQSALVIKFIIYL
jgi:hypothetical protein